MAYSYDKAAAEAVPGHSGVLQKFVQDFAASVLMLLTGKGSSDRLVWTNECESAFNVLKVSFCRSMCFCVPIPEDEYVLYTDASECAIGACLHVVCDEVELPVVAFFSHGLRGPN